MSSLILHLRISQKQVDLFVILVLVEVSQLSDCLVTTGSLIHVNQGTKFQIMNYRFFRDSAFLKIDSSAPTELDNHCY